MNHNLKNYIKKILKSDPLDIYNEEDDSVVLSNLELADTRYEIDSFSEEDRYIGSANICLAAMVYAGASQNKKQFLELSDDELALGFSNWDTLLQELLHEKFVIKTNDSTMDIRLVVDNTK